MTVSFALDKTEPEDLCLRIIDNYSVRASEEATVHDLLGTSFPLASQDLALPELYMATTLLFSADRIPALKTMSLDDVTDVFDLGLERLVGQYPAASSNFYKNERGIWHIQYTGDGIPIVLATSSRVLGAGYIGGGGRVDSDTCSRNFLVSDRSQPGLVIKLSRFACGSIIVGTSAHHWIVDHAGYFDMMALLAKAIITRLVPLSLRDHEASRQKQAVGSILWFQPPRHPSTGPRAW